MPTIAILNACRDLMLHRSNLQLAAAFDRLADILLDNAAKEYAPRVVGSLLDARSGLLRLRASIAELFAKELTLRLNGRKPCNIPTVGLLQPATRSIARLPMSSYASLASGESRTASN